MASTAHRISQSDQPDRCRPIVDIATGDLRTPHCRYGRQHELECQSHTLFLQSVSNIKDLSMRSKRVCDPSKHGIKLFGQMGGCRPGDVGLYAAVSEEGRVSTGDANCIVCDYMHFLAQLQRNLLKTLLCRISQAANVHSTSQLT